MGGFNNFDLVYYINLNHRTDRLNHITNEIKKTNIDATEFLGFKFNDINLKNGAIYKFDKN